MASREGYFFGTAGAIAIVTVLFGLTIIGWVTWFGEQKRIGAWAANMGWLPDSNTEIFYLRAGEQIRIYLAGKCYRYRTYPKGIPVGSFRKIPGSDYVKDGNKMVKLSEDGDSHGTSQFTTRWFKLKREGYFFLETRELRNRGDCQYLQNNFHAGWSQSNQSQTRRTTQPTIQPRKKTASLNRPTANRTTNIRRSYKIHRISLRPKRRQTIETPRPCLFELLSSRHLKLAANPSHTVVAYTNTSNSRRARGYLINFEKTASSCSESYERIKHLRDLARLSPAAYASKFYELNN